MRNYIIWRVMLIIPILIGVSFISFSLVNLSPSNPAEVALRVNEIVPTEEAISSMSKELGLDKPFFERYIIWLRNSIRFDFGRSYINNKPVADEILNALPPTLYLSSISLIMILSISIVVGILCAIYENSIFDKLIRLIIFFGAAMPSFWLALLSMWLFAVKLDAFPTSGMDGFKSIILPSTTLSLSYISTYIRLIRNNMIENKGENYILYAHIRGLKKVTIIKHMFKNSIQSSITALGMSIPKIIAGTIIVENIFAWPGIGRLCVSAIFNRDYPIIQAYIVMIALLFIICNLLVDIFAAYLDPRTRRVA